MTENTLRHLQKRLNDASDTKTKDWWERYLKHVIPFRGVKTAGIRRALHDWLEAEAIAVRLTPASQVGVALELLRQDHAEDKLAGILMLQEALIPAGAVDWQRDLPQFASLFDDGYIYDWNTCDWFCVKALDALVRLEGEPCARAISNWRNADNLWRRRAASVAFINLAKHGDANFDGFIDMMLETCGATIRSEERFAQTGTGWTLRELSLAEQDRVVNFIKRHSALFSAEGMRYATEKMPKETGERLRKSRRETMRHTRCSDM